MSRDLARVCCMVGICQARGHGRRPRSQAQACPHPAPSNPHPTSPPLLCTRRPRVHALSPTLRPQFQPVVRTIILAPSARFTSPQATCYPVCRTPAPRSAYKPTVPRAPHSCPPQASAREANAAANAKGGQGRSSTGGASGARGAGGGEPSRTPRAILAESWREDADLGEVVWALVQVFGPGFLARLPQPGRLPSMTR